MNTDKIYAEAIANEYAPKNTSKVCGAEKAGQKGQKRCQFFAFTFGILMTLVLGTGMCFSIGVIGNGNTGVL